MSVPIPSFFKIRCVFAIFILLLVLLLGLTRAYAVTCSFTGIPNTLYTSNPSYYATQSEAHDACVAFATGVGKSCKGPYDCSASDTGDCSWRAGYIEYWVDGVGSQYNQYQFFYCVAGDQCAAERVALETECGDIGYTIIDQETCEGRCNDCTQEAQEQCGDAEVIWNDDGDCSYQCRLPCQELHDRLSYDCGGTDKYWLRSSILTLPDGSKTEKCEGACGELPTGHEDTDGDGDPDSTDEDMDGDGIPNDQDGDIDGDGIPNDDDTAPTVPGGSDKKKPPGDYGDQNPDDPPPEDVPLPTWDCIEKWNNKKKECGDAGIAYWDNMTCTGRCNGDDPCGASDRLAADQACPYGYKMNPDCTYTCYICEKKEQDCVDSCKPAAVKTNICEENGGVIVSILCECENASACEQYKSACYASCSQNNCGGVKNYQCQEDSTGRIIIQNCECNDCGTPEVPDPKNPEPEDGDDVSGWLKGIKRDTEQIVDNTASIKGSVDGVKSSIDALGSALSKVTVKGEEITVLTGPGSLGTDQSVTGTGYGTAPADGDLPGETSFGTFTPRASGSSGDYGGQISATLNTLSIVASGAVCSVNLSYPVPSISGLALSFTWQNYPVDFCSYQDLFVMIGNILVFFTALSELYKFA